MAGSENIKAYTLANRKAWDLSAQHHRSGKEWQRQVKGFSQPGYSTFDTTMTGLLERVGIVTYQALNSVGLETELRI